MTFSDPSLATVPLATAHDDRSHINHYETLRLCPCNISMESRWRQVKVVRQHKKPELTCETSWQVSYWKTCFSLAADCCGMARINQLRPKILQVYGSHSLPSNSKPTADLSLPMVQGLCCHAVPLTLASALTVSLSKAPLKNYKTFAQWSEPERLVVKS